MSREMKSFTVLLLYPDYEEGPQTFQAHVEAATADDAVYEARFEAEEANHEEFAADDFLPLAVYEGHLIDLSSTS